MEMNNLTELFGQYDWREVIGMGIAAIVGTSSAVYDRIKDRERIHDITGLKSKNISTGFISAFTASFDPFPPIDPFHRNFGCGILGAASYISSYMFVTALLYYPPLRK